MRSVVGIYDLHAKAIVAIEQLRKAGYPGERISIIGQGGLIEGKANTVSAIAMKEINVSIVIGAVLGILTGVGLFAIPGFGFLYGAGSLYGGFAGFEAGIVGGGIIAVLTSIGIDIVNATRYEQQLNEGKFMVIVQGNENEISMAKDILHTGKDHLELNQH